MKTNSLRVAKGLIAFYKSEFTGSEKILAKLSREEKILYGV